MIVFVSQLSEGLSLGGLVNHISLPVEPFHGKANHCFMVGFIFTSYPSPVYQYSEITEVYDRNTCKKELQLNKSMKIASSVCSTSMNPYRWKCSVSLSIHNKSTSRINAMCNFR